MLFRLNLEKKITLESKHLETHIPIKEANNRLKAPKKKYNPAKESDFVTPNKILVIIEVYENGYSNQSADDSH